MQLRFRMLTATFLSGCLSGYFFVSDFHFIPIELGSGIFFGLATAVVYASYYEKSRLKLFLWLLVSIISWYLAYQLYGYMRGDASSGNGTGISPLSMFLCGSLGAIVLALGFSIIIERINLRKMVIIILGGGLAGVAMYFILMGLGSIVGFMLSFVIWQATVGLLLVPRINKI